MRIALIGATGLIGSELLPLLRSHELLSLSRRASLPVREGWREKIGGMEDWPSLLEGETVDVAIATIGTTWAKVKDWELFEAIDRHAVVNFARAAKAAGARQLIVVSSAMADADSRNNYLSLKGRMEADVRGLGFARLDIIRPGLLRGDRGSERRLGERLGIVISPLMNLILRGPLEKYQAIDAGRVAAAMAALVGKQGEGVFIHHNPELTALSQ
ncbi:nucleoside-diphosphate sugar epimerase [Sphingomicrobium flavum]|uniref:nucleoside-diphosphate sugar epimerase n=1 Tax=Sphingomicrobium flavum TaxID=1229164 RepID=UPI0021AD8160|nr:nucleoside-diphosphate sugar epimerase [Sphingomicrobium flavum]